MHRVRNVTQYRVIDMMEISPGKASIRITLTLHVFRVKKHGLYVGFGINTPYWSRWSERPCMWHVIRLHREYVLLRDKCRSSPGTTPFLYAVHVNTNIHRTSKTLLRICEFSVDTWICIYLCGYLTCPYIPCTPFLYYVRTTVVNQQRKRSRIPTRDTVNR